MTGPKQNLKTRNPVVLLAQTSKGRSIFYKSLIAPTPAFCQPTAFFGFSTVEHMKSILHWRSKKKKGAKVETANVALCSSPMQKDQPSSKFITEKKEKSSTKLNKSLEQGLNLSGSQQQGYSTAYSTPFPFKSSAKDSTPAHMMIYNSQASHHRISIMIAQPTSFGARARCSI